LNSCASLATCGALMTIFRQQEDDSWNFTVCYMDTPTRTTGFLHDPSGKLITLSKDEDCTLQDCTLYFERRRSVTVDADPEIQNKVTEVLIDKQRSQPREDWLDFLSQREAESCTCEATGNYQEDKSCRAFRTSPNDPAGENEPSVRYWCPVTEAGKKSCSNEIGLSDQDFEKHGDEYWSTSICKNAGCRCAVGLALRLWGDEAKNIHPKHAVADAEGATAGDEPLVGHKCDYWFKDDELPWCVVGFDSTCADRTTHQITGVSTKLYSSKIPCTRPLTRMVAAEAGLYCGIMKWFMLSLDALRYLTTIPLLYMVLTFLMWRCVDCNKTQVRAHAFDVRGEEEEGPRFTVFNDEEGDDSDDDAEDDEYAQESSGGAESESASEESVKTKKTTSKLAQSKKSSKK